MRRKLIVPGDSPWPQISVQPAFKFCDRIEVGPGASVEDGGNRRVVDIRSTGRGTNTLVANGSSEVLYKLARHLGAGVYCRHFGPAIRELVRMEPGRSGHRSSVDDEPRVRA
jgi:hypothetical protein